MIEAELQMFLHDGRVDQQGYLVQRQGGADSAASVRTRHFVRAIAHFELDVGFHALQQRKTVRMPLIARTE